MPVLVVLIALQTRGTLYAAAGVFILGSASDGLDGYLARRHGSSTKTGQWLDPLADKVFVASPVVILVVLGAFPVWAAAVIIVRELGVMALRIFLGTRKRSMPASQLAKVKTSLQLFAITLYILPLGRAAGPLKLTVLILAVVFTVYTAYDYVVAAVRFVRESRAS